LTRPGRLSVLPASPRLPPLWFVLALVVGAGVVALNQYKLIAGFGAGFHDYGLARSAILNTARGDTASMQPATNVAGSFMAWHWAPILYVVSFLNIFLPFDDLYGWLLAATWYGMVVAFAVLVRDLTGSWRFGGAAALALFLNAFSRRLFFGPHWEVTQVLFELLAAIAFLRRWPFAFVAGIGLAALAREDVPLYLAGFCLALGRETSDRTMKRTAWATAAGSVLYFLLAWFVIRPMFQSAGGLNWQGWRLDFVWGRGDTVSALVKDLLVHPFDLLEALASPHVAYLIAGFGFLPLLRPSFFLIACLLPILVFALARLPGYCQFREYNSAQFLGLLAVGSALGLCRLLKLRMIRPRRRSTAALAVLLVALVAGFIPRNMQRDVPRFGITLGDRPFPVTAGAREVRSALRAYPWGDRQVAAGFYSIVQIPHSRRVWFFEAWEAVRPDLIVIDEEHDLPVTLFLTGMKTPEALYARLERAGYRRHVLVRRVLLFEKRHRGRS